MSNSLSVEKPSRFSSNVYDLLKPNTLESLQLNWISFCFLVKPNFCSCCLLVESINWKCFRQIFVDGIANYVFFKMIEASMNNLLIIYLFQKADKPLGLGYNVVFFQKKNIILAFQWNPLLDQKAIRFSYQKTLYFSVVKLRKNTKTNGTLDLTKIKYIRI